jgi:hypothetical protein
MPSLQWEKFAEQLHGITAAQEFEKAQQIARLREELGGSE